MRDSVRSRLHHLSAGTQAERRGLQTLPSPMGAVLTSMLVIERKGNEREYIDIKESEVEDVMERFGAINDATSVAAFVASVSPHHLPSSA
jgi:hypothetical protein